jgi:two-component system, OmpR family, sensor histidine kinase TctE
VILRPARRSRSTAPDGADPPAAADPAPAPPGAAPPPGGARPALDLLGFGRIKEQRSLFGEILDWMLAPLLLLWPMSVALTWVVAQGIANRPYDRDLVALTRTVASHISVPAVAGGRREALLVLPPGTAELLRSDEVDERYFQVLGLRGELLGGDGALPAPARDDRVAPGEVRFADAEIDGKAVRIAVLAVAVPGAAPGTRLPVVQVAETLGKRSQLATEIIKGVILPQFVILPLAVLLVWLALARGIAPLNALQQHIRRRESHDLSPIDERDAPEEVAPFVRAINDLLARLDQSIAAQRHFLADAAHQLKTPLAGLRTQAELAQRELDIGAPDAPPAVRRSLVQIARSSQNAAHMVNQLLSMARAESKTQTRQQEPVDLAALAMETVRDFVTRAMDKRIDLGYEGPLADADEFDESGSPIVPAARDGPRPLVMGQPVLLREVIRNLVDNALLYTPAGGTVTVRVIADPFGQVVVLQVEDSGPGIPAAEREKVFHAFYRTLGTDVDGSGLGLAIVKEIAVQHGADVTLEDANLRHRAGLNDQGAAAFGPGARFTLRFPAAPAAAPAEAEAGGDEPLVRASAAA